MIQEVNYTRKCKITQGGIRKFYLLPFVKYNKLQVQYEGMTLTEFPESFIYVFECFGNYTQDSQVEDGAYFLNQTTSAQLPKVYDVLDIHNYLKQDYRVIVETNNGQYIMFGVYNGMMGSVGNNSGNDKAEFNGFNLDFEGREETTGLLIENLSDFFIVNTANLLNAELNFEV